MHVLGLNAFHGDASAALLRDGQPLLALEEERLTRVKHCAGFPEHAARACLAAARAEGRPVHIEHVAMSRDPRAQLAQKLLHVVRHGAPLAALGARLRNALKVRGVRDVLDQALGDAVAGAQLHHVEHHRAHLASAFLCSPFADAAVLSIDGFGDFVSTMWARGLDRRIEVLGQVGFPHSLGLLYTAVTQWLGFPYYGDEGKVMGLAPFGEPTMAAVLRRAIHLHDEGFALDLAWFNHVAEGVQMSWREGTPTLGRLFSSRMEEALGPARAPSAPLLDLHRDVAASLQVVTEEVIAHLARRLHARTGSARLCLAGGVALNSVANGKLRERTPFAEIFVQPAAGDGGTALGAALWVEHMVLGRPRGFVMRTAALGPRFDDAACERAITAAGLEPSIVVTRIVDQAQRLDRTAAALADGKVLGWFEGRMEFGPRALGQRSVLADPRREDMRDRLNSRIKRREGFRPFAPAILAERASEWFEDAEPSPAMTQVKRFRPEQCHRVPAVVHVDGTGRLQTVEREFAPVFHALICAFEARTGIPMILNTSFNENEPIVCSPQEAVACFARTDLDALVLGSYFLERGTARAASPQGQA